MLELALENFRVIDPFGFHIGHEMARSGAFQILKTIETNDIALTDGAVAVGNGAVLGDERSHGPLEDILDSGAEDDAGGTETDESDEQSSTDRSPGLRMLQCQLGLFRSLGERRHDHQARTAGLPVVLASFGIALAYLFYQMRPGLAAATAARFRPIHLFLLNKWYFDEFYDRVFVEPAKALGRGFWKSGDGELIDGVGPDGLARATQDLARRASGLQTGYIYHYAFAMLIGVASLVSWFLFLGTG